MEYGSLYSKGDWNYYRACSDKRLSLTTVPLTARARGRSSDISVIGRSCGLTRESSSFLILMYGLWHYQGLTVTVVLRQRVRIILGVKV